MMNKVVKILTLVFVALFLAATSYACFLCLKYYASKKVKDVNVTLSFPEEKQMITEKMLNASLATQIKNIKGMSFNQVHDTAILNELRSYAAIDDVVITSDIEGVLHVKVEQKNPFAKLGNDKEVGGYYLTSNCECFHSKTYFGAYKPVVVAGMDYDEVKKGGEKVSMLKTLFRYMENEPDGFLQDVVNTIQLPKNGGDIRLKTNVGVRDVHLGTIENLDEKVFKLKAFYKALDDDAVAKYKELDLEYDNLVVARNK